MESRCIDASELYAKDPKLKHEDVMILQKWLEKQSHLPQLEESQIIVFLHSCYYNIEKTKSAVECYFTKKTRHPEIFQCPSESIIRQTLSVAAHIILPKRSPEGFLIALKRFVEFSVENYNFLHHLKITTMEMALHLYKNGFENGVVVVFDMKGFTLGHLTKINPAAVKHFIEFLQEGAPVRIKNFHFVNAVTFMDKLMALIKPFLKSELFQLIEVHSSFNTLYKYIPKECLPEDYKGYLPSVCSMQGKTLPYFLENLDFFEWHDSQKVDDSKRTETQNIANSVFGVDGTFKKLELD